jgi:hypothetical protein
VIRLRQLISAKDAAIKELRASKKSIAQELETAQLAVKVAENGIIENGRSWLFRQKWGLCCNTPGVYRLLDHECGL